MDEALDNRLDRLDNRTARRALVLFAVTCALAMLASPVYVIYELVLGVLGFVATGMLARVFPGRATMAAMVISAGVLAGSLPYLLGAAFVS